MPQPKQPATTPQPPVRGDATSDPTPSLAPALSTKDSVGEKAAAEKAAAKKAKPATRGGSPAASKPKAAPKAKRKPAEAQTAATTSGPAAASKAAAARKAASATKPKETAAAGQDAKASAPADPATPEPGAKAARASSPAAARTAVAEPTAVRRAKPKPAAAEPAKSKPRAAQTAKPKPAAARPKAAPSGRAATPEPTTTARMASGSARAAAEPAPAPEPTSSGARDEALRANLASLRDLLAGGVVLTAQRLQEAVDEAVTRGRITRRDAEDLASGLLNAGRQQTAELVADLEQLLGRGRDDLSSAKSITKATVKGSSDRVLREIDRARRAAGIGPSFPILGYDELSSSQILKRLGELGADELHTVHEYERKHEDRSRVLKAIKEAEHAV